MFKLKERAAHKYLGKQQKLPEGGNVDPLGRQGKNRAGTALVHERRVRGGTCWGEGWGQDLQAEPGDTGGCCKNEGQGVSSVTFRSSENKSSTASRDLSSRPGPQWERSLKKCNAVPKSLPTMVGSALWVPWAESTRLSDKIRQLFFGS